MNGHCRVVPRHQDSRTSSGSSTDSPRPTSRTTWPCRSIQARDQVILPGRLTPAKVPPGTGK